MVKWICLFWHRILRIPRSKGYGVQSPFAYRFVRQVLNRRSFFTKNIDKDLLKPNHLGFSIKDSELFCRLIQYNKPDVLLTIGDTSQYFSNLLRATFTNNTYVQRDISLNKEVGLSVPLKMFVNETRVGSDGVTSFDKQYFDFIVLPAALFCPQLLELLLRHVKFSTLLVLTNIHASKSAWNNWCDLLSNARVVMSFDLYTHGIVFFDTTKSKMNFKVNYK